MQDTKEVGMVSGPGVDVVKDKVIQGNASSLVLVEELCFGLRGLNGLAFGIS